MSGNEDKLANEILEDAQRRAERNVSRARRDARKAVDAARSELDASREQAMREAATRGDEIHRAITAGIEHEARARWLQRREVLLDAALAEALARLTAGTEVDRRRSLEELLADAARAVGARPMTVRLRAADRAVLADDRIREIVRGLFPDASSDVSVTVTTDDSLTGGPLVESADGRCRFDNTYATRMRRLRGELRATLCADLDVELGDFGGSSAPGKPASGEASDA